MSATGETATHLISREIGIDVGHRVMDHGSKCANLHGHRYKIQAWCRGPLYSAGEQNGMVLDFGFLKEEMMNLIDDRFDHAFMFCIKDAVCGPMFGLDNPKFAQQVDAMLAEEQMFYGKNPAGLKICILPVVPTAENLARVWFDLLQPRVTVRTKGQGTLTAIKVWETPNCWASYGPASMESSSN